MATQIFKFLAEAPQSKADLARKLGKSKPTRYLNELMTRLLLSGLIEYILPDKPTSRLQKYRLTPKGRSLLHQT